MFWKAGCSPGGYKDIQTKEIASEIMQEFRRLEIYSMGAFLSRKDYRMLKERRNIYNVIFKPRSGKDLVINIEEGDYLFLVYGGQIWAIGKVTGDWNISKEHVWCKYYDECYSIFRETKWLTWFKPPLKIKDYPSINWGRNKGLSRVDTLAKLSEEYMRELLSLPAIAGVISKAISRIDKLSNKSLQARGKQKEEDGLKRFVEKAGMQEVLKYEKKRAYKNKVNTNSVRDVSGEFKGYDIESFDRKIEVKSFTGTGSIVLTSNEWSTAIKFLKEYWIYVVENALSKKPTITTIPFIKIKNEAKKRTFIDCRYEIKNWK
ncbi:MAG: DUF3883 domain-containing protein [Candidatus Caldarchaeum sp.]